MAIRTPTALNAKPKDLLDILLKIMLKMGIRAASLPTEASMKILTAHVLREYGGHTCEEITLAFDMAMTGKLDIDSKDVPCYENFSCLYFSRIMNAYRRWAAQEYKALERNEPLPPATLREAMDDIGMQEWLNQTILNAQDPEYAPEFCPEALYTWMEGNGKIRPGMAEEMEFLSLAVDRRQAWLLHQVEQWPSTAARYALSGFLEMKKQGFFTGTEIGALQSLAKKIALMTVILKLQA